VGLFISDFYSQKFFKKTESKVVKCKNERKIISREVFLASYMLHYSKKVALAEFWLI
jgi:hypothetical protein